ncbi:MAG: proline/glycine betaine ABC transporter permease [Candidatus Latescibacteria bacterium]|nr:proline/glycine betaine ABC transporter permease [Candidatus Latescibacterota bacterium]
MPANRTQGATGNAPSIDLTPSITEFVGARAAFYVGRFKLLLAGQNRWRVNWAALIFGPLWAAARGIWAFFWLFAILELVAWVQVGRGIWGDLGADKLAEAARLQAKSDQLMAEAARGDTNAELLVESAGNLARAAENARAASEAGEASTTTYLLVGLLLLGLFKLMEGLWADRVYERQYTRWRVDKRVPSGFNLYRLAGGCALLLLVFSLTLYRFTVSQPDQRIVSVPVPSTYHTHTANLIEDYLDRTARAGAGLFNSIAGGTEAVLNAIEAVFVETSWPVIVIFFLLAAWRLAGGRVAIFTGAALAYMGILGLWEKSMLTLALVSSAAVFCVLMGIPLGVWCARSSRVYAVVRPVLDMMQTMPAFVYLIPIIAFFGTGKVPGILATIAFSMPPVIRLTALGLAQVPKDVVEAARAFGATQWQLMTGVELPLAAPTIMTGVNQTILMCLSMVVIASLIGARGLGQEVLVALQFVAKGQGILAGLAILCCAMVLDRIVQGRFRRGDGA